MEVLQSFGFDIKLLVASVINFVILLFLLNKILYKPLLDMLDHRKKMIEESVKNSEQIEKKLYETKKSEQDILHRARLEASELLKKAEDQSKIRQTELLKKAEDQARNLVVASQARLEQQAAEMKKEIQDGLADIVIAATTTILRDHMPAAITKDYVEKVTQSISRKHE